MIIKTPSCTFTIREFLGEYVPPVPEEEIENGSEDASAFAEHVRQHEELELINFEINY